VGNRVGSSSVGKGVGSPTSNVGFEVVGYGVGFDVGSEVGSAVGSAVGSRVGSVRMFSNILGKFESLSKCV